MPARIARSNVSVAAPKNARNKNRKRNLDAFSIASHSTKDKRRVPQHRLGETIDDGPRPKRQKPNDEDDEGNEDSDEGDAKHKAPRRQTRPEDDGDVEMGSDSSGNEWTLGGLAEDDDDSDLDSDEAFGESDEERFEGFTFRGSSKGARKPAKKVGSKTKHSGEVDLNEGDEDEEDEEDLGEEGVDLATMLDDDDSQEMDQDEDEGSEDSGEDEAVSSSDDEDDGADDEERVARMRDRLETLDGAGQAAGKLKNGEAEVISVDDLLADLDPAAKSQFQAALKTKKKSAQPVTLAAPLPKRQQDKLNRELATAKAKEQLDRWRDTVMHNRRAEFLTFPLKDPDATEPLGKDKFVPVVPQTDLEQNIQRIMEESGMSIKAGKGAEDDTETTLLKAEELATNKLPLEEVERRRTELRRARELLFREEIKAKRIAKIKSKSYRRVHRKEREREAQKEREAAENAGVPMDEDEADKIDRKRAEERMSTKHRESKWAKSLKATNRTVWDEGARDSVYDQARRNDELKQRIAGKEVDGGDSSSDDLDEEDDEADVMKLRQMGHLSQGGAGPSEKGLANMKFMRVADAKRRAQNDEDVARIQKDLALENGEEDSGSDLEDQGLGRAIFAPKAKETPEVISQVKRSEMEEAEDSETETERHEQARFGNADLKNDINSGKFGPKSILKTSSTANMHHTQTQSHVVKSATTTEDNVWLNGSVNQKSKRDKARQRDIGENDIIAVDLVAQVPTKGAKRDRKKQSDGLIEPSDSARAPNTNGWQEVLHVAPSGTDQESDPESEHDALTITADTKSSFQSRAFAGDDVALAFQAEKEAAEVSEDEKEVSTHLPGWGSWTGENLSKSLRKANSRQKHNPLYKMKLPGGVNRELRKDKGRENVIISEKQDRKGKKFLAPVLPHQYTGQVGGKDIYERSLRVPMGPEWSTKEVFQRNTRPRVIVKKGTVVEALIKPLM